MIVITGMHRSGTSFTMNALMTAGLNIGPQEKLIGYDRWNQKGYYENSDIVNLNNQIILGNLINEKLWVIPAHKRSFFQNVVLGLYKSYYLLFPSYEKFENRARSKAEEIQRLMNQYDDIAVKDPRFSLLIKYWDQYGKIDKILYCFRHPFEVAMSVKKREKIPMIISYRTWSYHVDTFFHQVQKMKPMICFVNFNNFFDPRKRRNEFRRLVNFVGKPMDEDEIDPLIQKVLDPKLKNNNVTDEQLPPKIAQSYQQLLNYHASYSRPSVFNPEV